jgi:two-component sensor histidine kinase
MAADDGSREDADSVARPRRFDTLRFRLALFVFIALAPIVVANIAQGLLTIERERVAARDRLASAALQATAVQENIFAGADQVLRTLAALPSIRDAGPECAALLADAAKALPYAANISRIDRDGAVECAALTGAQGLNVAGVPWWERLRADGSLAISAVRFSPAAQRNVVVVARAVRGEDGTADGAMALAVDAAWLERAFEEGDLPEDTLVALIAADGSVVAGNEEAASPVGTPSASSDATLTEAEGPDGRAWSYLVSPIVDGHAYVSIAARSESLFRWGNLSLAVSLLLPVLMVALALATIWIATDRLVVRWLRYLQRVTAAYAAGHYALRLNRIGAAPAEFRELGGSVTKMAEAVRERDRRLRETVVHRTALVREIHHRIKNSLQIVTSLISLQAVQIKDPTTRASFEVLRGRVDALALAHRLIREAEDGSRIALQDLVSELAAQHASGIGRETQRIETRTVECLLPTDQAVPLALLLNELLTAVRPPVGREKQRVTVVVDRPEPEVLSLTVGSDAGSPAHAGRLPASALIDGFVAQLHGRITESRDESGGGTIKVLFANACL